MEYGNEKYTDEELKKALIEANGQPTKAAELLGIDYSGLYRRIRKNPELFEVQNAYKAKTFNNVANVGLNALLTGIMNEPMEDEEGNIIEGKFVKRKVDYRTRLSLIPNLMQTFKTADGIKEQIEVTTEGSINISDWLKMNNQNKKEE
ncbi:helix-turn-helix domain-containing protein [Elizabethkingia ursingii]|uniref:helix-turn-helix domain-containing protein n=1 Tax=Elizabethkingia ursingii TaxID=1756150 RepID=UPI0020138F87|nr:helix-turn-helix domain-containing protein [Elizabethkingia ursingii]MCL1671720.1 helix-turn-helix domain-containing protein [Elizabethkingia ursingii]